LIPRPETEGLVELVLARCSGGLVADIGTGSGCIALALAVEGQFDKIVAVEHSPAAAALARENVQRIGPKTAVEIREGDLLAPLGANGERFRAIVANPPYLTTSEYEELDPSVRAFEPSEPLVSGIDGLAATRALLRGPRRSSSPVASWRLKSTSSEMVQCASWVATMAGAWTSPMICSTVRGTRSLSRRISARREG